MVTLEDLIEKYNVDRAGIEREKAKLLARIEAYELAEIRKQAGLTQVQLAESMGVSQKRISEIEHGRAGAIKLSTLERYATALGGRLKVEIECPTADGTMKSLPVPLVAC